MSRTWMMNDVAPVIGAADDPAPAMVSVLSRILRYAARQTAMEVRRKAMAEEERWSQLTSSSMSWTFVGIQWRCVAE